MRRSRLVVLFAALALLLTGCRDEEPAEVSAPRVLASLQRIPNSIVVDTIGTAEAERYTAAVSASPDSVARYYRVQFQAIGATLRGDRFDAATGYIDLYADVGDTASVWLHVERQGLLGSRYTLVSGRRGEGLKDR